MIAGSFCCNLVTRLCRKRVSRLDNTAIMAESSHNEHPNIGEDTRSPPGYKWWDIPDDGSYQTWVDRPSIVQSDYSAQSALSYPAAFDEQDMNGVGTEGLI